MTLAIIVAMLEEVQPLRDLIKVRPKDQIRHITIEEGIYGDQSIFLIESGIGKANAALASTVAIERYQPQVILNYGVVGSLTKELTIGDVLIGDDFIYHDADDTAFGSPPGRVPRMPVSYPLHSSLETFLDGLMEEASAGPVQQGQVCTSDAFSTDPVRIQWIKDTFPKGRVVDMEATAIAQVAYTYDLPFLAIKIVSDEAGAQGAVDYEREKDRVAEQGRIFFEKVLQKLATSADLLKTEPGQ